MNDQIRALIFEVCNDWVSKGNLYTDDIHECFLNSTGNKGKYSFALDALAKMALAADQQPPQPERWRPTEQERAAIRAAQDHRAPIAELPNGSVAFLNYGDEPDCSQLDCPACGGSGHVGDTRAGAVLDVLAERRRQIEVKGWTPEHDDDHSNGEMSLAAGLYAISAGFATKYLGGETKTCPVPDGWPWADSWWKPTNARRDLVKSTALNLAELERLDRAERSAGDERGAS